MDKIIGEKINQEQRFLENGARVPVTLIKVVDTGELEVGDLIKVTGISKGKGFAGVVKRWGFAGGPRTHGQSDRERAPGSIGQTTTPGRVYKGKKMAGRMGGKTATLKNLEVLEISENSLVIKGLVPGVTGTRLSIVKEGKNKKFMPLFKEEGEKNANEEVKS